MSESKRLTLDELRQTSEYQMLTQKQQLFVATYVGAGIAEGHYNVISAIKTAYDATDESARVMSYSMMQNIRILAVLNLHFGIKPTDQFLKDLDRAIRNKHITHAQVELMLLKSRMLGLENPMRGKQSINRVRSKQELDELDAEALEAAKEAKAARKAKKTKEPVPPPVVKDEPHW